MALLLAGSARLTPAAHAQAVRGVVIEAGNRTPVVGATIELRGQDSRISDIVRATSDSLGRFALDAPRAGVFTIQAKRIGFLVADPDTVSLGRDETLSVEMRLDSRAVPLEPVAIKVRSDAWLADFERRKAGGFGRFLTRQDIEARGAPHTTDLFRMLPGMVLAPRGRGIPGADLLMRGTVGLCRPALWVDGLYVALNAQITLDDVLSPQMIEGVEVYNAVASAPSQYRTGDCGVVLIWTRRGSRTEGGRSHWKQLLVGAAAATLLIIVFVR